MLASRPRGELSGGKYTEYIIIYNSVGVLIATSEERLFKSRYLLQFSFLSQYHSRFFLNVVSNDCDFFVIHIENCFYCRVHERFDCISRSRLSTFPRCLSKKVTVCDMVSNSSNSKSTFIALKLSSILNILFLLNLPNLLIKVLIDLSGDLQ